MLPQIEQIVDSSVRAQKPLSLLSGLEPPHTSLSDPGRFMGLLSPIILILFSTVDRLWNQFPMRYTIASQFISYDLPRFVAMVS